jgi:hypothetical protein
MLMTAAGTSAPIAIAANAKPANQPENSVLATMKASAPRPLPISSRRPGSENASSKYPSMLGGP